MFWRIDHVHIGEESLVVYGLDILLERIPVQLGLRLRLYDPQDVLRRDMLVPRHPDGHDPGRLGRKDPDGQSQKANTSE